MRPARTPRRGVPNERVLRSATPRSRTHPATPRLPTPRPSSAAADPEIEVILPKLKLQGAVDTKKTQACLSARLVPRLQGAMDNLDKARNRVRTLHVTKLNYGFVSQQLQRLGDRAHFDTKVAAPPVHTEKKLRQRPTTSIYEQASFQPQVPSKQTARSLAW
ncbi:hypothetical protein SPRG_00396 [Saprolegnia parasitica CBS 223.65]|uniref:Uncharacterized protein n=1 Tax=Saprolegnia parasitica (strain CBS 223.65) TaxID=695850 RepID=A0A067DA86_SAPPC|nr:hypothetical protein SPRG_00396 [Saprolegnia parasitica CBS 223.65]KDO35551.1 hypothetical protein SPRG_00396 [Saprolegnia parasitica CBS 223.65]|eukprot:XP_012193885.1 hypothetical protein SPRG_00396 [Saprolegnia parasitica CBS 223.65]